MVEIRETEAFSAWLRRVKDEEAKGRIAARLRRLASGNPGDVQPVGEGVSELRIHYGPGYRIYLTWRGTEIVVLLGGGTKRGQERDILMAE
jgi:putative addiction module killer protein